MLSLFTLFTFSHGNCGGGAAWHTGDVKGLRSRPLWLLLAVKIGTFLELREGRPPFSLSFTTLTMFLAYEHYYWFYAWIPVFGAFIWFGESQASTFTYSKNSNIA